jgi:hypothetical protein
MFLDTAQLRDSVVLKAKELNYVPRSFRSATANVNLTVTVDDNTVSLITIPKGTTFTGKVGSNNFTFSTDQILTVTTGVLNPLDPTQIIFTQNNVPIYEGVYITDSYVVKPLANTDRQRFILSNPTIDTTSMTVTVVENNGANTIAYKLSSSILDLKQSSEVYFLQGAENNKYELVFGDNIVGRRPADGSIVLAEYRITNGQLPNGISVFTCDGTIAGSSNVVVDIVTDANGYPIPAVGGDIGEDIESVRKNATRFYATQDRAVTTKDYESLMRITYPEIQVISVYGGEEAVPPQYGKVFLSMKIANFDAIPDSKKIEYTNFLKTRAPLTIDTIFVEPEYTYASVRTKVKYNINKAAITSQDITTYVTSTIQNYNIENLNDFKSTILYSRLVTDIDNSHPSIISNETDYLLMKKVIPSTTAIKNYVIAFNIPLDTTLFPYPRVHLSSEAHTVISSKFIYKGQTVVMEDDGQGNMRIVQAKEQDHNTIIVIGSVDYTKGRIVIRGFKPDSYFGDSIRFYAKSATKDNTTGQQVIFEIPDDEIFVTVETVRQ